MASTQRRGHATGSSGLERALVLLLSAALGTGLSVALNLVGPLQLRSTKADGTEVVDVDISRILVDLEFYRDTDGSQVDKRNPLAVQSFMWIALFVGFGELFLRFRAARRGRALLHAGLLPEDERSLLTSEDLRAIYLKARASSPSEALPTLVKRIAMEFRKSNSIDRANALLDSSLELELHRLDLNYTLLRYVVWLIPTLGFVGTVIGIANAMAFVGGAGAGGMDQLLLPTTQKLAVAFYTTLLALVQSSILVFGMNAVQASEEGNLNETGQYCLENLIMRLVEPGQIGTTSSQR